MPELSTLFSKAYLKEKWQHAGFQKYFQNTGWMFFAKLGNMAVSFIATAYIARHLGPSNYGELSYAISFVSIFSFIAVLGIDQVLYRDLVIHPDKKNAYMGSAFGLRLAASFVAVILCISSAYLLSPKDVSIFLIFLLSISFIFNSFQIITYEFQAQVQSKYPAVLSVYVSIILNILKIAVVILGEGVIYLALVLLLESILYAIGFLYYRTKLYGMISSWRFDKTIAKKILRDSWPLIFSTAFALIYSRIDQIMIKNMMDATSVGLYDAAVRLSEVWYFIPGIIASSLFPAIINAKKTSEITYHRRIRKLALALVVLSIVIALPTTFLASWIIRTIFGPAFLGAVIILQIYIWSNIATSLNSVVNLFLITENHKRTLFFTSFASMATNVILNIYLIPRYGMSGAAVATLISYGVPFLIIMSMPKTRKLLRAKEPALSKDPNVTTMDSVQAADINGIGQI